MKRTIILGLVFGMVFGVAPFFLSQYIDIFISRIMLGLSIGLFSPHAVSLISFFYTGAERSKLPGYQMGITAFGNAILLLLSGCLSSIGGWETVFLLYIVYVIILALVLFFVPSVSQEKKEFPKNKEAFNTHIGKLLVLSFLILWDDQLKLPTFLVQEQIGQSETSSVLLALMNVAGMLAGVCFGFVYRKLKAYTLPFGFLSAITGWIDTLTNTRLSFGLMTFSLLGIGSYLLIRLIMYKKGS